MLVRNSTQHCSTADLLQGATPLPTLSVPRVLERPGCPTCGAIMRVLWIEPDSSHRDRHTLECRSCKEQIEAIVERDLD